MRVLIGHASAPSSQRQTAELPVVAAKSQKRPIKHANATKERCLIPPTLFTSSMNGAFGPASGFLPDELMSLIFLNCLEPDDIGCITPSSTSAPLVPSWVCRGWRRICLSTPQLWTGINLQDLTQDGSHAVNRRMLLSLLDLWINRSRSCPISIKFSYTNLSDDERSSMMLFLPEQDENNAYSQDVKALIDKLLSCQHRWRALDMTVLDLSVVEPLLQAVSAQPASPLLEHLSVSTIYLGIFGEIRIYNLGLSSQLRTIRIMSPLIVPEANGVRFERLTELNLKYCSSMMGCLQWIDKAPNLETLKVRFFGAEAEQLENETRVRRLERLSNLQISSFSSDSDPETFMSLLDVPVLVDLSLDMNDLIESRSWSCVVELLKRSRSRSLESLTLLGTPMNKEDIVECLSMSPKLTFLCLGTISDDILDELSASTPRTLKSVEPLCPRLEVLEIGGVDECSSRALVTFANSRCKNEYGHVSGSTGSGHEPGCEMDEQYRTLERLILPYDPYLAIFNHPGIVPCRERGLNVLHRAPSYEILPQLT